MAKQIPLPKKHPIPDNWQWIEAGKLVNIKSGFPFDSNRFSSNSDEGRPLIRIRDVLKGETETFTDEDCPKSYIIHSGEILIGMDGDFNVAKWKSADALLNQRVCCIESCSDFLLNNYLFYYLPEPLKKINEATPSVTVKHLSTKTLSQMSLPLPPLAEQRRIVARIESLFAKLDEAKEKAQAVIDGFEPRKSAILHKAFTGELIGISGYRITPLESIVKTIRIGPFGSALHKEDYISGGIPIVNPKHIVNQQIIYEEKATITEEKASELMAYRLKTGDIVMGRRGEMGRSAPVTEREAGWLCGTGSLIIRLQGDYNSVFYSQIIASHSSVQYLEENCVGSTMKNLNEKVIRSLPVPIYAKAQQDAIIATLNILLEKEQQAKEAAEAVLAQIDTMKKAILARAFRGELGTNDPSEKWAGELLKNAL